MAKITLSFTTKEARRLLKGLKTTADIAGDCAYGSRELVQVGVVDGLVYRLQSLVDSAGDVAPQGHSAAVATQEGSLIPFANAP